MRSPVLAALLTALLCALYGCGSGVSRNIDRLAADGEGRKDAMIELSMANTRDQPEIIRAAKDQSRPLEVRLGLITVLFRQLLNRGDADIRAALHELVSDPQPAMRLAVVRALGDLQEKQSAAPLVTAFNDNSPEVQLEVIGAFYKINQHLSAEDQKKILERALAIMQAKPTGELRERLLEVLEAGAEKISQQADQLVLKGQVADAEAVLTTALKQVPGSRNITFKLGRFYFDNEQKEKGLELLAQNGFLLRVKKLDPAPVIDGDLSDACWQNAAKIDSFYQCLETFVAKPALGKSEVRVGYTDDALYVAYKAYEEPSTKGIQRNVKQRDGDVYLDDCIEIFLDVNHNYKTCFQILVNALGTVDDLLHNPPQKDHSWSAKLETATKVEEKFWTLEVKIPLADLKGVPARPGTVWGFNVCSTRCGNTSEMGQWVPTYGGTARPSRFGFLIFE